MTVDHTGLLDVRRGANRDSRHLASNQGVNSSCRQGVNSGCRSTASWACLGADFDRELIKLDLSRYLPAYRSSPEGKPVAAGDTIAAAFASMAAAITKRQTVCLELTDARSGGGMWARPARNHKIPWLVAQQITTQRYTRCRRSLGDSDTGGGAGRSAANGDSGQTDARPSLVSIETEQLQMRHRWSDLAIVGERPEQMSEKMASMNSN